MDKTNEVKRCFMCMSENRAWLTKIIFPTKQDAEQVLDGIIKVAQSSEKKRVSLHTYFSLCGVQDRNEEVTKHLTWPLEIVRTTKIYKDAHGGYFINLPRTVIIDE